MVKKHPGFKAVQSSIASREGISSDRAGAILAASSRRASPAAKAKNPRLKRVKAAKPKRGSRGGKKGAFSFLDRDQDQM